MSVAKVSEISATSSKSFEDAIQQGIARASKPVRMSGYPPAARESRCLWARSLCGPIRAERRVGR